MRSCLSIVLIMLLPLSSVCAQGAAPAVPQSRIVPAASASSSTPAASASVDSMDMADIRTFTRAFSMIKKAYVDKVSDKRLMQAAVRGMLSNLDPHSEFLDHSALKSLGEDTDGAYAGIGVVVINMHGQLRIIAPLDGTPAARAGIRAGDIITSINGIAVDGEDIDVMADKLRGPVGSVLHLSVLHKKASVATPLTLTRERIEVASVRTRLLAPGYVDIRISEFQERTGDDLRKQLQALIAKHGPLQGAVLDLRSNPGGLVSAAVDVADTFLDSGVIVSTRGRLPQSDLTFTATPGDLLHGAPLVVLVDNGTASAAEIVAGALQDHHRALVMGRLTFGKGSVQTVLPVGDGDALKLTTARYYTPDGRSIQARGITPDITLQDLTVAPRDTPPTPILSESDLPHHLNAGTATPASASSAATQKAPLAMDDYAMSEALNVLKGLAIAKRR